MKRRLASIKPLLLALPIVLAGGRIRAQQGCLNGNLFMPMGVNGTIKVCPGPDARVPELQKQLNELQKTLNGNDALLREVSHAVRGVNALGRNVDANRQVELLESLSKQVQGWMAADQKQSQRQIAQLADQLDALQEAITQSREDQKTAQQTAAELNGRLGDAIAALDLTKAQQQLDSIQAKLDKIGDDTGQIRRAIEEQAAREKEAADRNRKQAEEWSAKLDKDPNMYARAQITPRKSPFDNQLQLTIYFHSLRPLSGPFIDSALSVSFRKGTAAWRVDATDRQVSGGGELWYLNLNPDDLGDRATLCFVAHDKPSGRLREWIQHYRISAANTAELGANFIPDGDPTMYLTDGEPCDGVKEVRREQVQPSVEERMQQRRQQQMAKAQEQIAAMRDQALKTAPEPAHFARIMALGSRRDDTNGGQWQIKVSAQPFRPGTTLYDVRVEANLLDESGRVTPLELSDRQLFANIESRYAWADHMGTRAVVCLTAKDPAHDKPYRLTQWFSIETSRVLWRDGVPGDKATFVPAQPATSTEASGAACQ